METDAVLELIQDVAARVITPRFRSLAAEEIQEKNPGDLVTIADRESEAEITTALTAAYPEAVVLGEETCADDPSLMQRFGAAEHAFTVDPVDGTKNFVHGSPDHAVMVAELRGGIVVRSWIWQPQHEAAYVAELGAGAWHNGQRLERCSPGGPSQSWCALTSRRAWLSREVDQMPALGLTWVCCGIDYPHLIAGDADVVLYGNALPWDHAPGSLLLREAGGVVGLGDGSPYDPSRPHRLRDRGPLVCAADPAVHATVLAAISRGALA